MAYLRLANNKLAIARSGATMITIGLRGCSSKERAIRQLLKVCEKDIDLRTLPPNYCGKTCIMVLDALQKRGWADGWSIRVLLRKCDNPWENTEQGVDYHAWLQHRDVVVDLSGNTLNTDTRHYCIVRHPDDETLIHHLMIGDENIEDFYIITIERDDLWQKIKKVA